MHQNIQIIINLFMILIYSVIRYCTCMYFRMGMKIVYALVYYFNGHLLVKQLKSSRWQNKW